MKLVFLYGMPATGKLTVGRELAAMTGFKLFHNHLVVDLLLGLFEFGSAPFVELREEMWLSIFERAAKSGMPGLIFTFAPEATVRAGFVDEVVRLMTRCADEVRFVELVCPFGELKERVSTEARRQFGKLSSVELFEKLHAEGVFRGYAMPEPELRVDTSEMEPRAAAMLITERLALTPLPGQ
ncbi:AAA family ATPase [Acidicapsa dinghuensis]|uniref:AAA family ATPase n=1 Tax=Acidicapsa dinghuensis TaxID=2218256 RepID=A0ABW1EJ32_9BACT|nr:AAA family ATPase [Acidicapsa dinghuensis]